MNVHPGEYVTVKPDLAALDTDVSKGNTRRSNGWTLTGSGEPPTAAVGSAIANAIFDATGVRIREAPMTPARVRAAPKGRRHPFRPSSRATRQGRSAGHPFGPSPSFARAIQLRFLEKIGSGPLLKMSCAGRIPQLVLLIIKRPDRGVVLETIDVSVPAFTADSISS